MPANGVPQRVLISFRCSDSAYRRLLRRQPVDPAYSGKERRSEATSADPKLLEKTRPGDRFGAVLERWLDNQEEYVDEGVHLLHPPAPASKMRVRQLTIPGKVMARFERFMSTRNPAPSREMVLRDAIYRFTGEV